jgi:hypothetical protein
MKDFSFKKTWRVDWDMILARKIRRILKEPTMFERLKLITSSVWSFIAPFVRIFLSAVGPALAAAATKAVTAAAQYYAGDNGKTKRDAAYDMIVSDLRRQGVEIGKQVTTSMVNAAIEAAVQNLKAQQAK